ncbi:hypothetical protein LJC42_07240 [Eubacteriales bacterium OttesenSCG-928-K08]|nr:hypothetical protein [Eubacteriales bacterium OttesenSCG-928-K08]
MDGALAKKRFVALIFVACLPLCCACAPANEPIVPEPKIAPVVELEPCFAPEVELEQDEGLIYDYEIIDIPQSEPTPRPTPSQEKIELTAEFLRGAWVGEAQESLLLEVIVFRESTADSALFIVTEPELVGRREHIRDIFLADKCLRVQDPVTVSVELSGDSISFLYAKMEPKTQSIEIYDQNTILLTTYEGKQEYELFYYRINEQ